ncbi:MAG: magnesium transporter, partial [Eubacteriales bacterium]
VWKGLRASLLSGIALAAANFLKIVLVDNMIFHNDVSLNVAAAVCVTLVLVVVFSKLVGATLSIYAKRVGIDPAVMASPLITTIVDALALLVYFNVAKALIAGL